MDRIHPDGRGWQQFDEDLVKAGREDGGMSVPVGCRTTAAAALSGPTDPGGENGARRDPGPDAGGLFPTRDPDILAVRRVFWGEAPGAGAEIGKMSKLCLTLIVRAL